jgi:hypothetical protein
MVSKQVNKSSIEIIPVPFDEEPAQKLIGVDLQMTE